LFTKTNSPSRIDGFIDPLGTQFQSATADFKGATIKKTRTKGRSHSRQILWARDFTGKL
jgi:hypothetical protein